MKPFTNAQRIGEGLGLAAAAALGVAMSSVFGLWLGPTNYETLFTATGVAGSGITLACWAGEYILGKQ